MWRELNIVNVFTLEVSFLGSNFGKYECFHYNPKIYYLMSQGLLQSILDATDVTSDKLREVLDEIEAKYPTQSKEKQDIKKLEENTANAN